MNFKHVISSANLSAISSRIGRNVSVGTAAAALAFTLATPNTADAVSVDIFLIADHNAPTSTTGAPFSLTTTKAYQLSNLNGGFRAREATLVDNFTFNIGTALTFNTVNDPNSGPSTGAPNENWLTDQGENGVAANESAASADSAYVNSEIAGWENSGIAGTTPAADEQLDFGRNSEVVFNSVSGGFTDLVLSDLGGLNPFDLRLCDTADCSTFERIFAGFSSSLQPTLLGLADFVSSDTGNAAETDQTWLFRFHETITSFVKVTEFDDRNVFTGARLQADFVGAGTPGSTTSPVPGPAGLPLLASGLGLFAWVLRRRSL